MIRRGLREGLLQGQRLVAAVLRLQHPPQGLHRQLARGRQAHRGAQLLLAARQIVQAVPDQAHHLMRLGAVQPGGQGRRQYRMGFAAAPLAEQGDGFGERIGQGHAGCTSKAMVMRLSSVVNGTVPCHM